MAKNKSTKRNKKGLTETQEKFLDVLFNEAKGDLRMAKDLAGYAKTSQMKQVTDPIKDEIIELTKQYLATNGPKAAMSVVSIMDDPTALGNREKLAASKDLLDRIGLKETEKLEIKTENPIFILPEKKDSYGEDE